MLVQLNQQFLVGASNTEGKTITAWFNNQAYHTAPLSVGLIHNAIIRARMGADYGIDVINEPMPYTEDTRKQMFQSDDRRDVAIVLSAAMAFFAAIFVLPYIKVRIRVLLQFITELNC